MGVMEQVIRDEIAWHEMMIAMCAGHDVLTPHERQHRSRLAALRAVLPEAGDPRARAATPHPPDTPVKGA